MSIEKVYFDAMLYAMEGEDPLKAIENHERRCQQDVVRNHRLPIKVNNGIPDEYRYKGTTREMEYEERKRIVDNNKVEFTKQQYERMGIRIVGKYDDLFYSVELPEGWEIEATGHSAWSDLIDNKGRKRASFFYKAAFYDRDAFINFSHRYSYATFPFDYYETVVAHEERKFKPWRLFLIDNGKRIKLLREITPTTDDEYLNVNDKMRTIARNYLDENYPGWEDINSYWD